MGRLRHRAPTESMPMTLLAALVALLLPLHPAAGPAQIIVIRHAEKPDDKSNPHLAPAGVERARRLVAYLTTEKALLAFGPPAAIFATATTSHEGGQRSQETVAPLAEALRLPVRADLTSKEFARFAKRLRADRSLDGKSVVVCGNHEWLPQLAEALGVSPQPPRWKKHDYDQVYVITYEGGRATLAVLHERLGRTR